MQVVLWGMSVGSLGFGVLMFLWPNVVSKLNEALRRDAVSLDRYLIRGRYVMGLFLLVSGYLFFVMGLR